MNSGEKLELARVPGVGGSYLRILLGRRKGLAGGRIVPRIEASVRGVQADPERLAQFRRVCSITDDTRLGPTFPLVLATPVHTAMLASPAFPLPVLGLIHLGNTIVQERPIENGEALDLHCSLEGQRVVDKGVEVDLVTRVAAGGEQVWESVSTVLSRTAPRRESAPRPAPPEPPGRDRSVVWSLPADLGRRYAKVAGDFNPIHQYALTARLFGFPRAIAHGMWSLTRCLAELADDLPAGRLRIEAAFKRPVLLPSSVLFSSWREGGALGFELRSPDAAKLHLAGRCALS